MLIIPVSGKISWKNPPWLTVLLIIVNCLVFFVFQADDDRLQRKAFNYYTGSGLAEIELDAFLKYREGNSGFSLDDLSDREVGELFRDMRKDNDFTRKLYGDEIIVPKSPEYKKWRLLRAGFERRQGRITSWKYGFIPAKKSILTAFTSLFMHGSIGHLAGNMLFLWLFGSILELGSGRLFFICLYLLTGITADLLFFLFNMGSHVPLIGASGAISGLMGGFAALYGKQKVKIFYSLGFYFNYVRFTAIYLLPFWICKEIYSQIAYADISSTAYMAHLGGLLGGGCLGVLCRRFPFAHGSDLFEDVSVDRETELMTMGLGHMEKLEFERAGTLFEEVLEINPQNERALRALFNIDKHSPEKNRIHRSAASLISMYLKDPATLARAEKLYEEYSGVVRPRLTPELFMDVALMFAQIGRPEASEKIIGKLLKARPEMPGMPAALLKLSHAWHKSNNPDRKQKCLRIIRAKYPSSPEAVHKIL